MRDDTGLACKGCPRLFTEKVLGWALEASRSAGGVTLVETSTLTGHELAADQPVTDGRQAWRRIVLSPAAPGPTAGTEVTLSLAADALVDPFLNQPATAFELTFPWPATDVVLFDDTAPEVTQVLLLGGFLEVELTEEPDLATVSSLALDGTAPAWALKADRYTLRTSTALAAGSHQLTVGVGLTDLQGLPLAAEQTHSFNVSAQDPSWIIHRQPDPREAATSTVGNTFGFQGHPRDAETGLLYLRNRYYDPELGRFITPDPMGYVDGPSMYGFAGYSPVNLSDPLGLVMGDNSGPIGPQVREIFPEPNRKEILVREHFRPIYIQVDPIKSSVAWNTKDIEKQLEKANEILSKKAGVYVFWTRIKEDPDPKEALTAEKAENLLQATALDFSKGTGGYEGLPIYYVRETSDNYSEGGRGRSPDSPADRTRAAVVNRYWRGKLTNQYVTAHELGHAIGGLCDPTFTKDPRCTFGAPRPEYGGVMNYPSPYYEGVQGEGLSEGEIKRLRKNAQGLATHPGESPP